MHFLKHVAGVGEGKVDVDLGQIWAELDLGPRTKFALLLMLYNFR
jgi:hypothetical protein